MTNNRESRWRFSLRNLIFAVFVMCAFCAANLSKGQPELMFRFSEADGGGAVYAWHLGWPMPYLRIPTGKYAHLPADFFMPGLIVDLAVAALLLATTVCILNVFNKVTFKRQANAA